MANKSIKLTLSQLLLDELDGNWPKKYRTRTEAINDAIRKLIIELEESQ